jgi:thiosulfate dehydrogenase (quinone) large subunit
MPQPTTGSTPSEPEKDAGSATRSRTDTGERPVGTEQERPSRQTTAGTENRADTPGTDTTAKAGKRRASVPEQSTAPAPEKTAMPTGSAAPTTAPPTPTTAPAAGTPAAGAPAAAVTTEPPPTATAPMQAPVGAPAHLAARPHWIWGLTRIALGWVFLWAFLDKLFGLGYSTPEARAWMNGASPTEGYLAGVDGPFRSFFNPMAGTPWADWLFMVGLAGIGVALVLGIGVRIAAVAGAVMMVLMWMAEWPIADNPFLDYHLVYALVLIGLAIVNAGDTVGFGRPWSRTGLVRAMPALR